MHELIEDVLPFLVVFFVLDGLAIVRRYEWLLLAPWGRFRAVRGAVVRRGRGSIVSMASPNSPW